MAERLVCDLCSRELEEAVVTLSYMGSEFKQGFRRCPGCGQVFVPEELALGRMLEVEKALEDK